MPRVSSAAIAFLAITLLGRAEAGLIAKVPRTETPDVLSSSHIAAPTQTPSILPGYEPRSTSGLPLGGIFVEPDPSDRPSTTPTLFPPTSTTSQISEETPCEDHMNSTMTHGMNHNMTHAKIPETTPTPTLDVDAGLQQKFVQTTYWACATLGTEAHCGWHEPILDASSGAHSAISSSSLALRAGGIALFVVGGVMLGL
ncbi:hypothetical protein F5B22DRAFT_643536 [Xylaria bambusicola]|uniref:uncharacterized protein n=1 Tax=Xylaria bambusicola TaxID=326684 RepID=UPI002007AABF|nr:uncharacterized protein F5B22DRAFT_643536 [Xylaria bambusicola]KAI0521954.1 hypothetical protein F5B22DRAFT_643536 [Xylaria bambusicola]